MQRLHPKYDLRILWAEHNVIITNQLIKFRDSSTMQCSFDIYKYLRYRQYMMQGRKHVFLTWVKRPYYFLTM